AALERTERDLNSRTEELQGQRNAIKEEQMRIEQERSQFKSEQEAATATLDQRLTDLDRRTAELTARERTLETRMDEIETVQQGLGALRTQMQSELSAIEQQKSDLLPHYGVKDPQNGGDGAADAGLPTAPDRKARESLQRFQKLCRDAKRRVV